MIAPGGPEHHAVGAPAPWVRFRSRVLDRVAAVALGVALGPLVAGLSWRVRRHDGPPGLVALDRTGRGGRTFPMWKVRTMGAADETGRSGGAVLTSGGDRRITPIGRVLRRHRLDELPQLLNVARGDMALIGCRPEAPAMVDLSDARWTDVLRVPPGITGATQIVVHAWEEDLLGGGGDHVERYVADILPVKLAIDRWYVRRGTPALDLAIVISMAERFILRRPVTVVDRWVRREVPEATVVPLAPGRTTMAHPRTAIREQGA